MKLGTPDRVPLMCQLSIGHYFLNSKIDPLDIWFESEGFAEALVKLHKEIQQKSTSNLMSWIVLQTTIHCL